MEEKLKTEKAEEGEGNECEGKEARRMTEMIVKKAKMIDREGSHDDEEEHPMVGQGTRGENVQDSRAEDGKKRKVMTGLGQGQRGETNGLGT